MAKRKIKRKKGRGFLSEQQRIDDPRFTSTELSIGVSINGKETEIPTMVPSLSKRDLKSLMSSSNPKTISNKIVNKAVTHAKKRISEGKSVFAGNKDRLEANRESASRGTVMNPKHSKPFSNKEDKNGFRKL